jgi:hypothetical protein
MGCSSSKSASKAPAQAATAVPEGDFKINLENPTGDLGMGVTVQQPEKKYILVEIVKDEGLIPAWNKNNENTPEVQVKPGDLIVVINGKFGNSEEMLAECKTSTITLAVKRAASPAEETVAEKLEADRPATSGPAAEGPAAETPAAEAEAAEAPLAQAPAAETLAAEASAPVSPTAEGSQAQQAPAANTPSAGAPAEEAPAAQSATEVPIAGAPTVEPPAGEAPAVEAPAEATVAEVPTADVPAAEASTAEAFEDNLVSVDPDPAEMGPGASESQMCRWC